ncbi:hypothetical protein HHK36_030448 [Tetracentron sinense]|uniref:Hpc2-related domain-containing protein n=1 Tax=Tetracentron sinense TaxID=13715 RepID=A0A834YB44_TETSI|nr:hypothetical protein HHK36_030448 [Tetracentron sinense]
MSDPVPHNSMEEEDKGDGGSSSRVSSSFAPMSAAASSPSSNDRQRFTVELRPGETTIVSWKKLMKEANKPNRSPPVPELPSGAHPALESRIAPGQPAEDELKDAPPSSRFSAVIEKIERLYMGKQSSDEEELDDVPDDDQYDTEDSFIDDAELDEYFQVDKSAIKHNGFFVNRGKLERINEPISSPNHEPKKRRRKDITRARGEKDDDHVPNKHAKMGNVRMKAAARTASLVGNKSSSPQSLAAISEHYEDVKSENQLNAPLGFSKKKSADPNTKLEHSSSLKVSSGVASIFPKEEKDIEKQKSGVIQSRDLGNKLKVASESSDTKHQKYREKSTSTQIDPQKARLLNNSNDLELFTKVRPKERNGSSELPDLNFPGCKYPIQTVKNPPTHVKEGSNVKTKGTMLERAIREFEQMVAESRPPTIEVQVADNSFHSVKRRLPREVKQKLAKVARLAQSSQGRISEELINRLMSILGHLVQRKTLKRNLKEMVELGLAAKQEKDDKFQDIKKEVVKMINMRVPSLKAKAFEQQDRASDDFQEILGSERKGVLKGKYSMDDAMDDMICDLYDLFVEGMDEDKGPQIRKLVPVPSAVQLAELWPNRLMDNHGIKAAICRAKERKRALYNRHKEKIKKKKFLTPKMEETVRGEANSITQPQSMQDRLPTDSDSRVLTSPNRMTSSMTTANQYLAPAVRTTSPSVDGSSLDRLKQEKVKGSTGTSSDEVRRTTDGALMKKKLKRKTESDLGETHFRPEKLSSQREKEGHKSHSEAASYPHKSSLQSTALPRL